MTVPKRAARRPWCWRRRIPIPFVSNISADGVVQFKIEDRKKIAKCAHDGLCQFCGLALDPLMVFMGGRDATRIRIFRQAPFHDECADFAIATCPYLRNTDDPQFKTYARSFKFAPCEFPHSDGGVTLRAFVVSSVVRVEPVNA